MNNPFRKNSYLAGIITGLAAPLVVFLLIYLFRFSGFSFSDYVSTLYKQQVLSAFLSLSIIPNLGMFFLFLRHNSERSSRGVLMATLFIGIFIFYFKYARV